MKKEVEFENNLLFQWINVLTKREQVAFSHFLHSPYFNQRADVRQLYTYLRNSSQPKTKGAAFAILYPDKAYDDQQFRLVCSYLRRLLERFLAIEQAQKQPFELKLKVAALLRERSVEQLHDRCLREAEQLLNKSAYRDSQYWFQYYELKEEAYRTAYSRRPERDPVYKELVPAFDRAVLTNKLRQHCLLLAHEQVYRWGYEAGLLADFLEEVPVSIFADAPVTALYYHCAKMLRSPEEETDFLAFKALWLANSHLFPSLEARNLTLLAINFLVRRKNAGYGGDYQDFLDLYKEGLQQGYLLRNGTLSRFTYHNIVGIALHTGATDWAHEFVEQWTDSLERRFRERMYHFSCAQIAYYSKDYDAALALLQKSNYHDLLLNLSARTLLLKIYFELGEWDALDSHLDAFQNYLRRKPEVGYHRNNYRNLIRAVKRLRAIPPHEQEQLTKLQQEVNAESIFMEKDWLLQQLVS